jgi:HEPN domain-containing protein
MLKVHGRSFFRISALLIGFERACLNYEDGQRRIVEGVVTPRVKRAVCDQMALVKKFCSQMGLDMSALHAEEGLSILRKRGATYADIHRCTSELHREIQRELSLVLLMEIPKRNVDYYEQANLFGEKVSRKFPKTVTDIQEAGRCFAVGRYTACVFHLMRVMEIGVQHLGKKLELTLTGEKEWQPILNEVNGVIKRMGNPPTPLTPRQKARRNKLAQAAVYLENVKNAWRNDVMHPKATYTDEEAEEVFRTAKAYMQYLAQIL